MRVFVLFMLLISGVYGSSQDQILLMSGKVLEGKITSSDTSGVDYEYVQKGKSKTIHIDHYRIYSYTQGQNKPVIMYEQDSTMGREYTVEQMGAFVEGEKYGLEHYKGTPVILYSFLLSGTATYVIQNIFAAPVGVTIGLSPLLFPRQKVNPDDVENKELLKDEYFHEGYKRVVRSKRLGRGLVSAAGGIIVGIGVAILTEDL